MGDIGEDVHPETKQILVHEDVKPGFNTTVDIKLPTGHNYGTRPRGKATRGRAGLYPKEYF